MSQRTEQVEDSSRFDESYLEALERWYHVPALALLIAFMLWVRLQAFDRFTRNGTVYFGGNDAWYHLRQVSYTVANWPSTMPFDPWTQFPYGTSQGQFGTLYDQLVATAALVVGLGSPDQQTIALTLLVAPAVLGALVAIPTYLIARRLAGRAGGVFAVLLLALLPGTFLARSVVGFSDHHVAEVLFQTLAVAATMAAIAVAEREKPVYELVVGRDYTALREPVGWSVLAGVALAAYVWAWPPGVLLVGILGTYYLLKLTFDQIRGVSPDHVGFVATISMGVGGLLMLVPLGTTSMSGASSFSLLQPVLTLAVAVGAAFMVWLAREWEARDLSPQLYPAPIAGLIGVGSLFVYLALPSLWQTIQGNIIRFIGFGTGARTRTIGEAQPFLSRTGFGVEWYHLIMREYGLLLFTAAIAVALLLWRIYRADRHRGEHLLLIVWTAFITSAAFTQVRFNYYLVVPVAVLNAYLFREVLVAVGLGASSLENVRDVSGYQVVTLLFVVLVLVPGLLVPITYGQGSQRSQTVVTAGAANGPADVTQWHSSLGWMEENTPNEGTFGGADNGMAHYGTYDEGDGNYDYPEGSYGVMSWWDYGHWITTLGERIPNANPFQQQARTAAEFLLAQDEDKAESVMESVSEDDAKSRYVAVDWKMASTYSQINGKFFAPTVFHENFSQSDFSEPLYVIQDEQVRSTGLQIRSQNYYDSQVAQLYLYHGSAVEPEPVVVDWDTRMLQTTDGDEFEAKIVPSGPNASLVQRFDSMEEARTYVEEDGSSQVGGLGRFPSERIPALEHYRLVHASEENALNSQRYFTMVQREMSTMPDEGAAGMLATSPSWVKLFERVPGATVEGTGPANTTVTASVRMQVPTTGETFTYTQRAETDGNGEFTMVLPYSTTGYDEWGPENGYTNVSVRAAGPYEFATPEEATDEGFVKYNATADVSEAKVIGEDEEPVTVELTESVYVPEGARNNSSANNSSENSSTDGNSSSLTFVGGDLPDLTRLPGEATAPTDGGPDAPAVDVAARVAP